MKRSLSMIAMVAAAMMITFSACKKNEDLKSSSVESDLKSLEADFSVKGDGELTKIITKRLVKTDDCRYIVSGTIEYYKNRVLVCTIDFGDGRCDNIATKTVDGNTTRFSLDKRGKGDKDSDFTKIIVEPLVTTDDCDFIVSGIIKFYKGDKWIATIDYGDGTCDDLATKTWDGGSKVFSLTGKH